MALDLESRKLLAGIYGLKPSEKIAIKERLYSNGFMEMLEEIEEKKAIKELAILNDSFDNSIFSHSTKEGTVYNISFTVRSWQKLNKFGSDEFKKLVTEPYGKDKQLKIVREAILNKAIRLENNEFRINDDDIGYPDQEHIAFLEVIDGLAKEGFLKTRDGTFYIDTGNFEYDIKLLKDIPELKRERAQKEKPKRQKPVLKNEPVLSPKFRFSQGVLFRDFCNEVLIRRGENTQEYRLLDTAIALPVRETIDALTENIEMEWRQLYDTARRLNDKIKDIFKVDGFFQIDFQNKKLHRTVE